MLERMKIGTRLAVGFGLVSLVLAAVVVTGVTRLSLLDSDIKAITRTNNVEMRHATEMQAASLQIGNSIRNLLVFNDDEEVRRERDAMRNGKATLDKEAAALAAMMAADATTTEAEKAKLDAATDLLKDGRAAARADRDAGGQRQEGRSRAPAARRIPAEERAPARCARRARRPPDQTQR